MKSAALMMSFVLALEVQAAEPAEARGLIGPKGTLGVDVYKKRRAQLMEKLGKAATVIYDEMSFNGLRDGMDFYWLTGFTEPGAALMLDPSAPVFKEALFFTEHNVENEVWSGERAALPSQALEQSTGIEKIMRVYKLPETLLKACDHANLLAFVGEFSPSKEAAPKSLEALRRAASATLNCQIKDLHHTLSRMRAVKSPAEIALIRKAVAATAEGHRAALSAAKAGVAEYVVKDAAEDAMRKAGMRHVAYDSITGSGPNGAVLHYPKDDRVMRQGDVVVADIGAEWEMYASDVTRSFPVGGKFTAEQRAVYEAVLKAQLAGIAKAKAGVSIAEIQQAVTASIRQSGYYDALPHSCCHYVGLEVHDAGDLEDPLPEGAVITVEPGIYLPNRGFGVRIEDDVLITKTGTEVLSKDIPKTADEMERLTGKP